MKDWKASDYLTPAQPQRASLRPLRLFVASALATFLLITLAFRSCLPSTVSPWLSAYKEVKETQKPFSWDSVSPSRYWAFSARIATLAAPVTLVVYIGFAAVCIILRNISHERGKVYIGLLSNILTQIDRRIRGPHISLVL
jgi:hypothetical protein